MKNARSIWSFPSPLPGLCPVFAGGTGGYHPRLISGVPSGLGKVRRGGFTLLELLIASIAASLVLVAVYGVFTSAVRMRDNATARNRATRLLSRATNVIRNDLENALVSGGILASTLQGDSNGTDGGSTFPGYLKLTTTGGKDTSGTSTSSGTTEMYGDVEQVEYYIVSDTSAATSGTSKGGDLVRVVTRDLLDSTQTGTQQQQILTGVQSFQVSFYDGSQWQTSWQISGSNAASGTSASASTGTSSSSSTSGTTGSGTTAVTLPEAIRVDIQQTTPPGATQAPAPVEVMVPWVTTPFLSGTNFSVGSDTTSSQ